MWCSALAGGRLGVRREHAAGSTTGAKRQCRFVCVSQLQRVSRWERCMCRPRSMSRRSVDHCSTAALSRRCCLLRRAGIGVNGLRLLATPAHAHVTESTTFAPDDWRSDGIFFGHAVLGRELRAHCQGRQQARSRCCRAPGPVVGPGPLAWSCIQGCSTALCGGQGARGNRSNSSAVDVTLSEAERGGSMRSWRGAAAGWLISGHWKPMEGSGNEIRTGLNGQKRGWLP